MNRLESQLLTLCKATEEREWEYPATEVTDQSIIELASELIREQIMSNLHDEIPYRLVQETVGWTELSDGSLRIDQDWTVETKSQKNILLNKRAATVQVIINKSLPSLQKLLNREVHLFVRVISKEK